MKDTGRNQTYNLEGTRQVSVLDVAEGIRRVLGNDVRIEFVPARPGDFGGKDVSGEKAQRELGWVPQVDFEEGIRLTIDWFRQRLGSR
jgi:UDP-glucose 4-epimerase